MENVIDVTNVDLVKLVKKVYAMSVPVGMGFLHYVEGNLTTEQATSLIDRNNKTVIHMDYIAGRQCKFRVFKENDRLYTMNEWYDHTEDQFRELMAYVGIEV